MARDRYSKEGLMRQVRQVRLLTRIFAVLLVTPLGINKLVSEQFGVLTSNASADFLIQLSMVLLFFSILTGANYDVGLIGLVCEEPVRHGIFAWRGVGFVLFLAVFYVSLWFAEDINMFCMILSAYWAVNFTGWVYLYKVLIPEPITRARERYRRSR